MCTCITYQTDEFYFGRNLDLEYSFGEQIVITPRNYRFPFEGNEDGQNHFAMIGMANITDHYPLYAEAANEKGLCMAGLNFPENAVYHEETIGKENIASYEIIPWILRRFSNAEDAAEYLRKVVVTGKAFAETMPPAPLHWMLADRKTCYVIEPMKDGLHIYQNPYGVLTNNPPFPFHMENVKQYLNVTSESPTNQFCKELDLKPFGQGLGSFGLPGDFSPASRFVKALFLRWNSVSSKGKYGDVTQFFHILDGVGMVRGSVRTEEGRNDITTYSCCISPEQGVYYCKTYENYQIQAVDMFKEDLSGMELIAYQMPENQSICWRNKET